MDIVFVPAFLKKLLAVLQIALKFPCVFAFWVAFPFY
jgi:hypothetical protein